MTSIAILAAVLDGGEGAVRGVWRRVVLGLARMLHGLFRSRVLLVMAVVWVAGSHEDAQRACRYGIRMTFKPYQDVVDEGGDPESAMSRELFQPVWSQAPEWFEQRMATCGLQRPGKGTLRETKKTDWRIIGAMRLTHRGSTFNNGPLTKWSEEGLMLLETYREPLDAGVVKIIDAFELREPIKVEVKDIVDRHLLNSFFLCLPLVE